MTRPNDWHPYDTPPDLPNPAPRKWWLTVAAIVGCVALWVAGKVRMLWK